MSRFGRWGWRSGARAAAVAMLLAAAFFGVFAYGATLAWGYAALEILVAGAGLLWVATWTRDDRPPARLLLVALAPLLVALLQVLPAPGWVVQRASPTTWSAEQECRKVLKEAPRSCLSVYPEATWRAGVQASLFLLAALVVAALAAGPRVAAMFALGIGTLGLAEWAVALAFYPGRYKSVYGTWHDMLAPYTYWRLSQRWPVLHSSSVCTTSTIDFGPIRYVAQRLELGDVFGSFVVSNHFAGCLELCLPFVFGVWLAACGSGKWRAVRLLGPIGVAALTAPAVGTVLLQAQSRAGAVSLVLAAVATLWSDASQRRSPWRYPWLALAISMVVAAIGFFVASAEQTPAAALHRLAAPIDEDSIQFASATLRGRMYWWSICWKMFQDNPISGIGLGGFGAAAPAAVAPNPTYWYFAHNDYLQWLAETGLVGLAMLVFVAWAIGSLRNRRPAGAPPLAEERSWGQIAAASGSAGALAAIGLHSVIDWNLHVPANALLAAIALGLAIASRCTTSLAALPKSVKRAKTDKAASQPAKQPGATDKAAQLSDSDKAQPGAGDKAQARRASVAAPAASARSRSSAASGGKQPADETDALIEELAKYLRELLPVVRYRAVRILTAIMLLAGAVSAAREWIADRAIDRLRVNFDRPARPDDDLAERQAETRALLPAAESVARGDGWIAGAGAWNADYARRIGETYLQLSGGRPTSDLILAHDWLSRAQRRRPIDKTLSQTLQQIAAHYEIERLAPAREHGAQSGN